MFVSLFKALCFPFFMKQLAFLVFSEFLPLLKSVGGQDALWLCKKDQLGALLGGMPGFTGRFCYSMPPQPGNTPVLGTGISSGAYPNPLLLQSCL